MHLIRGHYSHNISLPLNRPIWTDRLWVGYRLNYHRIFALLFLDVQISRADDLAFNVDSWPTLLVFIVHDKHLVVSLVAFELNLNFLVTSGSWLIGLLFFNSYHLSLNWRGNFLFLYFFGNIFGDSFVLFYDVAWSLVCGLDYSHATFELLTAA